MSDFTADSEFLPALVQTVSDVKARAQTIAAALESLLPLTSDEPYPNVHTDGTIHNPQMDVNEMIDHAYKIRELAGKLYERNAKGAFSEHKSVRPR